MDCASVPLAEILPQQPPFVMIDRLELYEGTLVETSFMVREECLFCSGGVLSSCGLMENIAQTAAAREGYICRYVLHVPQGIGYIGQIKDFRVHALPRVGERLRTRMEVLVDFDNVIMFSASVRSSDGTLLAEGSMKTASTKTPKP